MAEQAERDPDRLWFDDGQSYVEIDDKGYCVVHDTEKLAYYGGPEVLLQTSILQLGEKTDEGVLIKAAAIPWFEIFKAITKDPDFIYKFAQAPTKFEEFIAGAYWQANWDEVTLTPRSGDKGRDVIATKRGLCTVRVLEQTKAYSAGHLVTHDEVRAMHGVLAADQNASKGIVTTTSDFQPKVHDEFASFMPFRLELKNGKQLLKWLADIQGESDSATPAI